MATAIDELQSEETSATIQVRNLLRGFLLIAVLAVAYVARDLLLPVVLALFIALTFRPAIRYSTKHHVPPLLAAAFFFGLLFAGGFSIFFFASGPVVIWFDDAPAMFKAFSDKFGGLQSLLDTITNLTAKLQNVTKTAYEAPIQQVVVRESALPAIFSVVTGYPIQFLITLLTTLILALFLMASGDLFYEKLVRILPNLSARKQALHIAYAIEDEISSYVLTLSAINFIMGISVTVAFYLLGMPLAYLWGLLAFLLNYIPYLGALTGIVLSAFMAIVSFDSLGYALLIPLAYGACSVIESEVLSPQIMGHSLQMNSVAILLSLAFWTWMWGIAGTALALPFLVTIKVFCYHLEGLAGLGEFIGTHHVRSVTEST